MTFESGGLLIVPIYTWLPPASYVVFLTTLVKAIYHFGVHHLDLMVLRNDFANSN